MRVFSIIAFTSLALFCLDCRSQDEIRLLVRGDDIGSTHAANLGCIESYQQGIMRSVEIMVPCPWFPEAVSMLNKNPGLDVGIHITLTSEWENIKWGPLTHAPSISDEDGYFFPMI
ncbi:MAG: ChbG/HpnK family deacetylase, partial [Bacteroidales bacterium]|nr:ChbG/HpnK family deacetylase [Bacteroidales bacterium]